MPSATTRADRLTALLRPRSVAVLGASATRTASGNEALLNLLDHGYDGRLHVVHPRARTIEGLPAVPAVADLPSEVDVALVSLPAPALPGALRELAARRCRSVVVPTIGLGADVTREVAEIAEQADVLVHGPNCMGLINLVDGIPLWFYRGLLVDSEPGGIGLVTQSGAASFVTRMAGPGMFSTIVTTGSELDLGIPDYLSWMATDPATTAAAIIVESIKDVAGFTEAVRQLRAAGKPLVALKVGRTAAGSAATTAHTGALIGRDEAYRALFARLDVPVVADYDELAETLRCLAVPGLPAAAGRRIGVVTISGGQAALAADLAADIGAETPAFSEKTVRELEHDLPGAPPQNPLDTGACLTYLDGDYVRTYARAVELVASDVNVDSVMVVLDAHDNMSGPELDFIADEYRGLREVAARIVDKPMVVASPSARSLHPRVAGLLGPGVAVLRGLRNAAVALSCLSGNRVPVPEPAARTGPDEAVVRELRTVIADHRGPLPVELTHRVLRAYGIPVVESALVPDADAGARWAEAHGYPVVVKVSSPDIAHRSDVGGVVTGVGNTDELRAAVRRIADDVTAARPGALIAGYEIQEQVVASTEAMVGAVADPVFGATVAVGSGGTLVELLDDVASAPVPVERPEATAMIGRTRLGRVLGGYRNLTPPTDTTALADVVCRLSTLAADLAGLVTEVDLNPVLVEHGTGRVRVVDALLVAARD